MNMGEVLSEVQAEIKKCKHEIERLQAINEIQNLMSTFQYLHTAHKHKDVMALYAKKQKDVRINFANQGYWEGFDAPQRAWAFLDRMTDNPPPGMMAIHPITTPVIVVAGDGKTAKGVWIGTGISASSMGRRDEGRGPNAAWAWQKYGVDFIKEDGKWKFWHFHIYRIFRLDWDAARWEDQFKKDEPTMIVEIQPDGPSVDDFPYLPTTTQVLAPIPPTPYETWEQTFSY
jgi:hypothetical protein